VDTDNPNCARSLRHSIALPADRPGVPNLDRWLGHLAGITRVASALSMVYALGDVHWFLDRIPMPIAPNDSLAMYYERVHV
jgi:hypothetical protein